MFHVKTLIEFTDLEANKLRKVGSEFDVTTPERLRVLLKNNPRKQKLVEVLYAKKRCSKKYQGKSIAFVQGNLFYIGGIETFLYNFVKHYKNRNITIITYKIDEEQLIHLSEYADIIIDNFKPRHYDTLILGNYDGAQYLTHLSGDNIYQMIHADINAMRSSVPAYSDLKIKKDGRVKKVICVSETAYNGLPEIKSENKEIIYNILDKDYDQDNKVFITLCRATMEKGMGRVIQMAKEFKTAGKHFIWFLCCSLEQVKDPRIIHEINKIKEFIIIPPGIYNKMLIKGCDYLVQLSDTESFCYSAYEALQRGVPVILTDFPEAYNTIQDGENGYIIKRDLSNLDIDKIFNHKPINITYEDRCDYSKWEKVFNGEL